MSQSFCFIICFASIISSVLSEVIYSVVAPGSIRSYLKYTVVISIYEADGPCKIQIGISSTKYNIYEVVDILPMSTKNVTFKLPRLEDDKYRLNVNGVAGITIDNSTDLNYYNYKPLILIQTDKANYKPGDVVQYRVLFLDKNTIPAVLNVSKAVFIKIRDPDWNHVKLLKNFEIIHGVFTGNLQLSNKPILGSWRIELYYDPKSPVYKEFLVSNYHLPQFDVIIDATENVALSDEVIKITIRSYYTFGKAVKGEATIRVRDDNHSKEKTISFDGEGHVEFNIQDNGYSEFKESDVKFLNISATVQDLGGSIVESSKMFTLHKHNITIRPINPELSVIVGKLATYKVDIRTLHGSPIRDDKNYVELHIGTEHFQSKLNGNGIATFTFTPTSNVQFLEVKCSYLGILKNFKQIKLKISDDTVDLIELSCYTKPRLEDYLFITVKWKEPIKFFISIVTSNDRIIRIVHKKVDADDRLYTITLTPTFKAIPKAILVQYFYKNNLRFKEMAIEFEEEIHNTLDLSTSGNASPGDNTEMQISTDPYSLVGILAVDKRVLLLGTGNDISIEKILQDRLQHDIKTPSLRGSGRYPGKVSGLVTLTNANYPYNYSRRYYSNPKSSEFYIDSIQRDQFPDVWIYKKFYTGNRRKFNFHKKLPDSLSTWALTGLSLTTKTDSLPRDHFPDDWIYEEFYTGNQTKFRFHKKLPDSITSWVITGFSLNKKTGIALTTNPAIIQVFKPFFITIHLPYSVKNGEIISIPVLIFNNMNERHEIEVSMDNSDKNYEIIEVDECILDPTKSLKRITVSANSVGKVSFVIKLTNRGIITVKITALMGLVVDKVHQNLKVEPEGITLHRNSAFYINLNDKGEQQMSVTIDIPADTVPNSEHIEISAIGDLIGLTSENLENLVHMPIGSGEQNMLNFVPSILVLKYLRTIKLDVPELTKKALNMLKIGYQRELNFNNEDGCFGDYGRESQSSAYIGSTWLTAYVVRSFQQAAEFIDIDEKVIKNALIFLISKQTTQGNFVENGLLVEYPYTDDMALTAFVLLAFLEDEEYRKMFHTIIKKGTAFLVKNLDATNNTHSLSITALVLQKVKDTWAYPLLARLIDIAENENGYMWWVKNVNKKSKKNLFYTDGSAVEITSYVLQAMLVNQSGNIWFVAKWLIMQSKNKGGFISPLETAVGLQTLIIFAEKTGLKGAVKMDIDFVCEGGEVKDKGTITILPEKSMILMKHELPKQTRKIKFTVKGNSSALVAISYQYNVVEKEPVFDYAFNLTITIRPNTLPKKLILRVCAEFVPPTGSDTFKVYRVVLEVALPSGFTADRKLLNENGYNRTALFVDMEISDSIAVYQLKTLRIKEQTCIEVEATRISDVVERKPVPVVIYDKNGIYYKTTKYYEVKRPICAAVVDECNLDCEKSADSNLLIAHSFSRPKLNLNFVYFAFNLQLCILQFAVHPFE